MFHVDELAADAPGATCDVMCAVCGTLTTLPRLARRAYRLELAR